jgi:hypothetical protein
VGPSCVLKQLWEKSVSERIQVLHGIVANSDACVQWRYLECGVELRHVASEVLGQGRFGMLEAVPQSPIAH